MWKNCQQKLPICCEIENLILDRWWLRIWNQKINDFVYQNLEDCRMDKIQELNNVLIDAEKILIGRVRSRPDRVRRGRLLWTPCKCTKIFIVSNAQKNFQSRNFNSHDVQKRSNVLIDAVRGWSLDKKRWKKSGLRAKVKRIMDSEKR